MGEGTGLAEVVAAGSPSGKWKLVPWPLRHVLAVLSLLIILDKFKSLRNNGCHPYNHNN